MNPYKITEPTCISFSGGRTSAYMLYKVLEAGGGQLPSDAIVCFANTGKEDEATLRFVQDCSENWGVPITWLEYRPDGYIVTDFDHASRNGEPFNLLTTKKSYLPNPVTRFCTEELKVKPIQALTGLRDDETMIGVRADESHRIPKLRARGLLLPLVTAGVYKQNVREFWKSSAFDLQLSERDGITNLGNCDLCFMKGTAQKMAIVSDKPSRAVWWAQQEQKIGATFHKDHPSYAQMLKFSQEQRDMFDANEEAISCFCGD